ncbi:beta-defensin 1 isoform X1 [Anser cygnoides]|uniref:beta-defensin 1 isoform X1 n=2 Tax=Anser cygnoides TaxID=8845 RepID=UPI0034D31A59
MCQGAKSHSRGIWDLPRSLFSDFSRRTKSPLANPAARELRGLPRERGRRKARRRGFSWRAVSLALSGFGVTPPMPAQAMKVMLLLLLVLLVACQAATVPDTVMCRKIKGECSFLLCSLFKTSIGTCYNGLAKCCIPL